MKNKLLKIINHYGIEKQLRKFSEENFEFIEAIIQGEDAYYNSLLVASLTDFNKPHIKEEIADNLVLLSQFILYYNINLDDIEKIFKQKVNRQVKKIENFENETK